MLERGLDVTALEPSPGMATVLRQHGRARRRDDVRGLDGGARRVRPRLRRAGLALGGRHDRLSAWSQPRSGPVERLPCSGTNPRSGTGISVATSTPSTPRTRPRSCGHPSSGTSTPPSSSSKRRDDFEAVTKLTVPLAPAVHDRRVRRVDGHALEPPHARRRRPHAAARRASVRSSSATGAGSRSCTTRTRTWRAGVSPSGTRRPSGSSLAPCPRP